MTIWSVAWLAALSGCGRCDILADHGLTAQNSCPTGRVRLLATVDIQDVQRGTLGHFTLRPVASWMESTGTGSPIERNFEGPVSVKVRLEGFDDEVELTALEANPAYPSARNGRITLPPVPDGDHVLLVDLDAGFDTATIRVPLSLYEPALVHVLTDRPLYRPGEDVLLRSLVLSRAGQLPLGARPGRWTVTGPSGETLLDEVAKADSWGVAASSLPLDPQAAQGIYRVSYVSGAHRDDVTFAIKPYALPRMVVEASASRPWSTAGDPLEVQGVARYRSGAPIPDRQVVASLRSTSGAWPIPLAWSERVDVKTGADGSFTLRWGDVPNDLRDRSELMVTISVTDEGGESATTTVPLVLSEHPLQAIPLTELDQALAAGGNNRAYIRVMTPDGTPLANAQVTVSNPWVPTRKAKTALADEDGVIALQLDPGDPVTLVTEPLPVRYSPPPPPTAERPSIVSATGSFSRALSLTEQAALPVMERALERCQIMTTVRNTRASLTVRVVNGRVQSAHPQVADPPSSCAADALLGLNLPVKTDTLSVLASIPPAATPSFDVANETRVGSEGGVIDLIDRAALRARQCLGAGEGTEGEALTLHWMVAEKSRSIGIDAQPSTEAGLSPSSAACVMRTFANLSLPEPSESVIVGSSQLTLIVPEVPGAPPPPARQQATTRDGFELRVEASLAGRNLGATPLRFEVGTMPPFRIRASPPVVVAGSTVTMELLRSGDATIELPEELSLLQAGKVVTTTKLDGNSATFTLPPDTTGFMEASFLGQTARVFVQRADRLSLSLTPDKSTYAPGETALLRIETRSGDRPQNAAVGLVGVDAALGQLAPLPGPDEYGRVTIQASSAQPAFGSFDARALMLGRIRGVNAQQAAVLRVSSLPPDVNLRPSVSGSGAATTQAHDVFNSAFSRVYALAIAKVGAWERDTPDTEKLDNPRMRAIWDEALAELRTAGNPAVDAFGRELGLLTLPPETLTLLDPRRMVGDGTRVPQDLQAWPGWVAKEVQP